MILSFIAALQLAATVPAIQIETTTTSETTGTVAVPATTSRSVMLVDGKNFRMEELEHSGPPSPVRNTGSVMLMHGADRKMFSLDPAKKEYWEIDLTKMQSQLTTMLKSMPGLEMKFSDMRADVKDLGDGEPVLGHPTRHYQMTMTMTMNALMLADTMSVSMKNSSETWFAKDLPVEDNTMAADTSVLTQFRDLIPGLNAGKFREQLAKLPRLVPLKSVSTSSSSFGPVDMVIKVTQLATRVEKRSVPTSTFEVPADYKKVDMPNLGGSSNQ